MKYKLLKELPLLTDKVGEEVEVVEMPTGVLIGGYRFGGFGIPHLLKDGFIEEVKPKRWRAEIGESFWEVSASMGMLTVLEGPETATNADDNRYRQGNYFETEEKAEAFLDDIFALLREIKKD